MSDCSKLAHRFERIVGTKNVVQDQSRISDYSIAGCAPTLVVVPGSPEEISEIVKTADQLRATIIPWGGGTAMGRGHVPTAYDIALPLRRLQTVTDFDVANLTVTVQAGLTLSELQTHLASARQFLPINPPSPRRPQ